MPSQSGRDVVTFGGQFPQPRPALRDSAAGRCVGAAVFCAIASGSPDFTLAGGFAANGYADHSPGKYGLGACLLSEVVLTMMFLFVIMGATHGKAPTGFAPIAMGRLDPHPRNQHFCEPGAQHGSCAFRGRLGALATWRLFWVAPLIGGARFGGLIYRWLSPEPAGEVTG